MSHSSEDIEDITCPRVDMNFIFECSTLYLTSERSERVRYRVEHDKTKFISTSGHVIFCLLYEQTNDDFFDDFPKISEHFPKIFQNCSEGPTKSSFSKDLAKSKVKLKSKAEFILLYKHQ